MQAYWNNQPLIGLSSDLTLQWPKSLLGHFWYLSFFMKNVKFSISWSKSKPSLAIHQRSGNAHCYSAKFSSLDGTENRFCPSPSAAVRESSSDKKLDFKRSCQTCPYYCVFTWKAQSTYVLLLSFVGWNDKRGIWNCQLTIVICLLNDLHHLINCIFKSGLARNWTAGSINQSEFRAMGHMDGLDRTLSSIFFSLFFW